MQHMDTIPNDALLNEKGKQVKPTLYSYLQLFNPSKNADSWGVGLSAESAVSCDLDDLPQGHSHPVKHSFFVFVGWLTVGMPETRLQNSCGFYFNNNLYYNTLKIIQRTCHASKNGSLPKSPGPLAPPAASPH